MRIVLRAILAVALLLGSGAADWAPASSPAHASCCCGTPAGAEDSCPCPKPEGSRTPSQSLCRDRAPVAASLAVRRTQAERRTEPRPEPVAWVRAEADALAAGSLPRAQGRDPDLGRHLARLSTFRI